MHRLGGLTARLGRLRPPLRAGVRQCAGICGDASALARYSASRSPQALQLAARGRRRLCSSPGVGPLPTEPSTSAAAAPVAEAVIAVRSLWESFAELLIEHPMKTNAIASGVLCSLGDALAQAFEWRLGVTSPEKESYNFMRTARMAVWGTLIGGPVLALWYRTLHTLGEAISVSYAPVVGGRMAWLAERTPAMSWLADLHVEKSVAVAPAKVLMGKVVLDTMLFQAPFLNLYFAVMGALEGLSPMEIVEKTKASFHRAWALSFLVWAPVQSVNLYFVPVHFQPLVVAGVNVGWKTTLSLLNHYHDYGSPRSADVAAAQGAGEGGAPAREGGGAAGGGGSAAAAAAAAWEHERSQLRTRISQLVAENKALRLQLGQLHAAFAASMSMSAQGAPMRAPMNAQGAPAAAQGAGRLRGGGHPSGG